MASESWTPTGSSHPRRVPWPGRMAVQWHLWRGHDVRLNTTISVPEWDPTAIGIFAACTCGKTWSW
jgi:hypothetical protein